MKLLNIALALGLAGIGAVEQVTSAQAANFTFSFSSVGAGPDQGLLNVTTDDSTDIITSISGNINGNTVTGLSNGPFDFTPEGGDVFIADNKIAFKSGEILASFNGFGVTTTGLTYNFYSSLAPLDGSGLDILNGVAAFDNNGALITDNNPSEFDFPLGANFSGITATAVPEPNAQAALLGLPLLVGMQMLKKRKALKAN